MNDLTIAAIENPPTDLVELWDRVAAGMDWLTAHDPSGIFHLWYKAGVTDKSAMPAQEGRHGAPGTFSTPLVLDEWRRYYGQRVLWEGMWSRMERLEARELRRVGT